MHTSSIAVVTLLTISSLFNQALGQANNGNKGGGNNANSASLALNPQVVQKASNSNGTPKDGQAPSLTDPENFINFCQGKTVTNGLQLTGGSCNGIVMGDIPSKENMISAIIVNPQVGKTIAPNTAFDVAVQVQNLEAGVFTNPDNTYYAAPQQLKGGKVVGHCHVVIQKLGSFNDATPPSATTFAFFKGINDDGNGRGLLKATVTAGLPEGFYRVCTIMGTSNHQPPLMPVAQRGAQEDCTKFQVTANGNANANNNNNGNANGSKANNPNNNNGQTTTAAAAATTTAAANNANSQTRNGRDTTTAASGGRGQQTTTAAAAAATTTARNGRNGQEGNNPNNNPNNANAGSKSTSAAATTAAQGGRKDRVQVGETMRGDVAGAAAVTTTADTTTATDDSRRREQRGRWERYAHKRRYVEHHAPLPRFMARPMVL